jgi:hypothetical protein
MFSIDSRLLGDGFRFSPRTGELGLLPNGEAGNEDPLVGVRVNRNSFADNCQYVLLEMNISDQPSAVFSSGLTPTDESSDDINPILSSFCIRFRPRKTPSRLIFMRHSPLGFPASGVFFDASVVIYGEGSFKWKYQYSDAHSIIAICLVGLVGALKSLLEGLEMEDIKRLSLRRVGCLNGWM